MGDFVVDFYWASQAIIETVQVAFPSLESRPDSNVHDTPPPVLAAKEMGPRHTTDYGNGRWRNTSSYYFNAGCNMDIGIACGDGDVGILSPIDLQRVSDWFLDRYSTKNPNILRNGSKINFTFVHTGRAYNFHAAVGG